MGIPDARSARWTFLTNHAHVLLCLAGRPELRLRDVAVLVGVTERAVQRIVADLEFAGYLTRSRDGRQNRYQIEEDLPLRHTVEAHQTVRALISMGVPPVVSAGGPAAKASSRRKTARPAAKSLGPARSPRRSH